MSLSIDQLRETIARLRAPGGCPWDREQTAASLAPSLIEEAYEVVDALERAHAADLEEELGDLLINILMQAEIASENGGFNADSIARNASEKLVRRHPHVFGESSARTSDAVLTQWEEIKQAERKAKAKAGGIVVGSEPSHLDGVARTFPALVRAQKIQKKAAKAGFDWERAEDVLAKIREEVAEVEAELSEAGKIGPKERLTDELGDLLFAVVNLTRFLSIDAESALHAATTKFEKRFRAMEGALPGGRMFKDLSSTEMNNLWEEAKTREVKTPEKRA
jgi:MazG family protein